MRKIEIRPLPMNGRPSFFEGAIGTFETSVSIDAQMFLLNPVRLTFSISGMGNFSAMPAPSLSGNSEFKIGSPAFSFLATKGLNIPALNFLNISLPPSYLVRLIYPLQTSHFSIPKLNNTNQYRGKNLKSKLTQVSNGSNLIKLTLKKEKRKKP